MPKCFSYARAVHALSKDLATVHLPGQQPGGNRGMLPFEMVVAVCTSLSGLLLPVVLAAPERRAAVCTHSLNQLLSV